MVAYAKPQQREKEESEKLRQRDQIKFIDLRFERWQVVGLSELCRGKAMVAYAKPQQREKEESERPRGERDQIKFFFFPLLGLCIGHCSPSLSLITKNRIKNLSGFAVDFLDMVHHSTIFIMSVGEIICLKSLPNDCQLFFMTCHFYSQSLFTRNFADRSRTY